MDKDQIKFELDHTCRHLAEAGKKAGISFIIYLSIVITITIVIFCYPESSNVSVPFLGLSINKWLGSNILLVLMCAAFLNFAIFHKYHRILYNKAAMLISHNDDWEPLFHWYLFSPSLFFFFDQICGESQLKIVRFTANVLLILLLLNFIIFPFILLFIIGKSTHFGAVWWITGTISFLLIFFVAILFLGFRDYETIIEKLEKRSRIFWY